MTPTSISLAPAYVLDRRNFLRAPAAVRGKETGSELLVQVRGLTNVLSLFVIVAAVFLPGLYLVREAVMLAASSASCRSGSRKLRDANEFSFGPIRELGFLFLGIFLTMMPALQYLGQHGDAARLRAPVPLLLGCGMLSAILDDASTSLNFLTLEEASVPPESMHIRADGTAAPEAEVLG